LVEHRADAFLAGGRLKIGVVLDMPRTLTELLIDSGCTITLMPLESVTTVG